jgi:hypothetical protein
MKLKSLICVAPSDKVVPWHSGYIMSKDELGLNPSTHMLDGQYSAWFMIFKPSRRWILKTGPATSYRQNKTLVQAEC